MRWNFAEVIMNAKSFLKIWLLCIDFEKFTSINLGDETLVERSKCCDCSLGKFIGVNFSKLTHKTKFSGWLFIHYHIINCIIIVKCCICSQSHVYSWTYKCIWNQLCSIVNKSSEYFQNYILFITNRCLAMQLPSSVCT